MNVLKNNWNKIKPWLAFFGVFVVGLAVGSILTVKIAMHRMEKIAEQGPEAINQLIVKRMDHELGLKPEQKAEIEKIVKERQQKIREIRIQVAPQVIQILAEGRKQIEANLNPEQKAKFGAWADKQRERHDRFTAK